MAVHSIQLTSLPSYSTSAHLLLRILSIGARTIERYDLTLSRHDS